MCWAFEKKGPKKGTTGQLINPATLHDGPKYWLLEEIHQKNPGGASRRQESVNDQTFKENQQNKVWFGD